MTFKTIDKTSNEKPSQWRGEQYKTAWLDGEAVSLSRYDEKTGYYTATFTSGINARVFWHELEGMTL